MAILSRYVSTTKAASILGVSITLVKTLVDEHKLQGWKTQGGHRRISMESIEAYVARFQRQGKTAATGPATATVRRLSVVPGKPRAQAVPATPQITMAVQTPELLDAIRNHRVVSPVALSQLRLVASPAQALAALVSGRPNILVLEMTGSVADQERLLRPLGDLDAHGSPVSVLVITRHTGLNLPALPQQRCCVHIFTAPVSLEWARGCLAGMLTLLTSLQWTLPQTTQASAGDKGLTAALAATARARN